MVWPASAPLRFRGEPVGWALAKQHAPAAGVYARAHRALRGTIIPRYRFLVSSTPTHIISLFRVTLRDFHDEVIGLAIFSAAARRTNDDRPLGKREYDCERVNGHLPRPSCATFSSSPSPSSSPASSSSHPPPLPSSSSSSSSSPSSGHPPGITVIFSRCSRNRCTQVARYPREIMLSLAGRFADDRRERCSVRIPVFSRVKRYDLFATLSPG